jgi:hypothetical protein
MMESMKMEMKITVPAELDGHRIKALVGRARTPTAQAGAVLSPGDLLVETC